jgi:hypothetical protein
VPTVSSSAVDDALAYYSIGDVARALGRTVETIRLWERGGRIPKARRDLVSGARFYTQADIAALRALVGRDTPSEKGEGSVGEAALRSGDPP